MVSKICCPISLRHEQLKSIIGQSKIGTVANMTINQTTNQPNNHPNIEASGFLAALSSFRSIVVRWSVRRSVGPSISPRRLLKSDLQSIKWYLKPTYLSTYATAVTVVTFVTVVTVVTVVTKKFKNSKTKNQNSKTQIVTKQKTQIVTKLKNLNCDKNLKLKF